MRKKPFFLPVFFFLALTSFALAADITISPPNITASPNSQFTINVNVANVSSLFGAAFDLIFDPAVLQFVSAQKGTFLEQGASTNLLTSVSPSGTLIVGYSRLATDGAATGVTGSGSLITLTFNALTNGTSSLTFQNNALCDANSVSGCNIILTNWTGGAVNVETASTNISNLSFTPQVEGTVNISGKDFTLTVFAAGGTTQRLRLVPMVFNISVRRVAPSNRSISMS